MRKTLGILMIITAVVLSLSGCEALFTKSVFTGFAADPADMSPSQLEAYAEGLLGGGDADAMAVAFTALADDLPADAADDPELYLLATDLAMGGSHLTEVMMDVADMALTGDVPADPVAFYDEVMASLDVAMLEDAVDIFSDVSALSNADEIITETQYANAAAALAIVILNDVGNDPADLNTDPRYATLQDWATLGGVDIESYL